MVAMVKSRSVMAGRTPAGSFTMLIWMLSPISRPSTSTMMACGISPARQTTSMSWRTTLSTPPRLMPGDRPSFLKFTGTCTRTRDLSVTRMKSTWIGRSVTGSKCTSRGSTRSLLPSTLRSKRVV